MRVPSVQPSIQSTRAGAHQACLRVAEARRRGDANAAIKAHAQWDHRSFRSSQRLVCVAREGCRQALSVGRHEPTACHHLAIASVTIPAPSAGTASTWSMWRRAPAWLCAGWSGPAGHAYRIGVSRGRARWKREPGIDDRDWDPPCTPRIGRYTPDPPPAPLPRSQGGDGWWTEPSQPRWPAPSPARESMIAAQLARDPLGELFDWSDD